jgi:hypothetical protein
MRGDRRQLIPLWMILANVGIKFGGADDRFELIDDELPLSAVVREALCPAVQKEF